MSNNKISCSYNEKLQKLADKYYTETGKEKASAKEIALWAISTKQWEPPQDLIISKCREDFSRAMREQHIIDDSGKTIRAKHVARIIRGDKQLHLWADIRNAPRSHMEKSFQQRRVQIVGDCRQLKRDMDYYNQQHPSESPIQLVFDFRDDIEEGEYSGEYPEYQSS